MKHLLNFKLFESKVKKSEKIDILRDDKYIVVRPLTHTASCKYGAYTQWCISVPGAEYVWDSSPDAIVIFILQKDYKISPLRYKKIQKLIELNELKKEGEITRTQLNSFRTLMENHQGEDLSKIALVFSKNNLNDPEIWDNNNIKLNDQYDYYSYNDYFELPIDQYVIDAIEEYVNSL
jgi:hypothetical protein